MTYDEIAARVGVRVCPSCDHGDHKVGFIYLGRVHWAPRRVVKPGLRRFLKLAAMTVLGIERMKEPQKTYWTAALADDLAHGLHVRFPRKYSELDRAFVRARLAGARDMDPETRRRVERWARDP